tara:strand:- start:504 stop:737 length:234 start_codon:yes stop_codon:yes gene_type:complete
MISDYFPKEYRVYKYNEQGLDCTSASIEIGATGTIDKCEVEKSNFDIEHVENSVAENMRIALIDKLREEADRLERLK